MPRKQPNKLAIRRTAYAIKMNLEKGEAEESFEYSPIFYHFDRSDLENLQKIAKDISSDLISKERKTFAGTLIALKDLLMK